ncbi:hypothetical protein BX616_009976 [Lobosporangium transversale]|nr:hypothetical protein BX616_009976 [Lobosporangium transversale]
MSPSTSPQADIISLPTLSSVPVSASESTRVTASSFVTHTHIATITSRSASPSSNPSSSPVKISPRSKSPLTGQNDREPCGHSDQAINSEDEQLNQILSLPQQEQHRQRTHGRSRESSPLQARTASPSEESTGATIAAAAAAAAASYTSQELAIAYSMITSTRQKQKREQTHKTQQLTQTQDMRPRLRQSRFPP